MDARFQARGRDDASWNSTARVKAAVTKGKGWTATLAIPLREIGAYVGENQTWPLNLNRTMPAAGGQAAEWSWAVMNGNDYHRVQDYGAVTGVTVPERADGVTRQAEAPPPPAPFDKGTEAGGVTVYRRIPELRIRRVRTGPRTRWPQHPGLARTQVASPSAEATGSRTPPSTCPTPSPATTPRPRPTRGSGRGGRGSPALRPLPLQRRQLRGRRRGGHGVHRALLPRQRARRARGARASGVRHLPRRRRRRARRAGGPAGPRDRGRHPPGVEGGGGQRGRGPLRDRAGRGRRAVREGRRVGRPGVAGQAPAAGSFTYRVLAVDFQDNIGPWSREASARCAKAFERRHSPGRSGTGRAMRRRCARCTRRASRRRSGAG